MKNQPTVGWPWHSCDGDGAGMQNASQICGTILKRGAMPAVWMLHCTYRTLEQTSILRCLGLSYGFSVFLRRCTARYLSTKKY